jgi:hypothetical protein
MSISLRHSIFALAINGYTKHKREESNVLEFQFENGLNFWSLCEGSNATISLKKQTLPLLHSKLLRQE